MNIPPTQKTTVRLLSWTSNPVQTVYVQWMASRNTEQVPDPAAVDANSPEVLDVFKKVIDMRIPLAETLDFIFLLEHVPIALREQLVRHRVGHSFGERIGADVVPDLSASTFWTQTMRVMRMDDFATDGEYLVPASIENNNNPMASKPELAELPGGRPRKTVEQFYHEQFLWMQSAYRKLIAAGVPVEDARNILPLGAMHRMTWKVNLSALFHVLGKRSCTIAQLGMWEPVIRGIVDELANRVHPHFRRLVDPPCFEAGEWTGCKFGLENDNRVKGDDPYPPCPLYLNKHTERAQAVALTVDGGAPWIKSADGWHHVDATKDAAAVKSAKAFGTLWGRHPCTGEVTQ